MPFGATVMRLLLSRVGVGLTEKSLATAGYSATEHFAEMSYLVRLVFGVV